MKTKSKFSIALLLLMAVLTITGCKKNPPTPTPAPVPATVKINGYNNLGMISVAVNFTVTPNDSKISQAGVAYSTGNSATNATKIMAKSSSGTITISLNGLNINTKYNIWAYIKTVDGTIYSSKKIHIWTYGLMDIDGNGYHTVVINHRTWTVENLKVTHYRNGDLIPEVQDSTVWLHDTKGARCYYHNNKAKYDSVYGALYNGYVISDPRGIAPKGWHVPTAKEYGDLILSIPGKDAKAGGAMKEKGTQHWKAPNTGATNSSSFTALPGGDRGVTREHQNIVTFDDFGYYTTFWTSSESPMLNSAYAWWLDYNDAWINAGSFTKNYGFSVRLVKNK